MSRPHASPIKVLYVDGVGPFGGASRSLHETIRAMPAGHVAAYFVVANGTVVPLYRSVAQDLLTTRGLSRFDNTRYGHYRGVRWLIVLRELLHAPSTIAILIRAKRRWKSVDVIHANEITEIIPALLAKLLFRAPVVLHVRSLQRVDYESRRVRWLHDQLRRAADAIVAIDENVRASLPPDVAVEVIHNSFSSAKDSQEDPAICAQLDQLRPGALKVGFVGNLHLSKGVFDLIDAAAIVRQSGRDVEFVVVGGATRPDRGMKAWLLERAGLAQDVYTRALDRISRGDLANSFHLLGHTRDIQSVYERIDVLCFPSHFDAPGRPVFEAAFSGVPCIAAVSKPRPDTLIHGETGLAIPSHDPQKLAEAIIHFVDNRCEVTRMGNNARELARRNFVPEINAAKLYQVYSRVAATKREHGRTLATT